MDDWVELGLLGSKGTLGQSHFLSIVPSRERARELADCAFLAQPNRQALFEGLMRLELWREATVTGNDFLCFFWGTMQVGERWPPWQDDRMCSEETALPLRDHWQAFCLPPFSVLSVLRHIFPCTFKPGFLLCKKPFLKKPNSDGKYFYSIDPVP